MALDPTHPRATPASEELEATAPRQESLVGQVIDGRFRLKARLTRLPARGLHLPGNKRISERAREGLVSPLQVRSAARGGVPLGARKVVHQRLAGSLRGVDAEILHAVVDREDVGAACQRDEERSPLHGTHGTQASNTSPRPAARPPATPDGRCLPAGPMEEPGSMRRTLALASLCAACATTPPGPTAEVKRPEPTPQREAITNVIPFDVAACGPRALQLAPLNEDVLTGALLSLGPALQECFVHPGSRDGRPFSLRAKVAVTDGSVAVELLGAGASEQGQTCVRAAIAKLPLLSGTATAEVPVPVAPQAVKLGDTASNDAAGALRLALPQACACFAPVTGAPPSLTARVTRAGVTVTPAGPVADCLAPQLQEALAGAKAEFSVPLLLKQSYGEADPAAAAALRFQQLDGVRGQRAADVVLAAGRRGAAALAYDELALRYKRKPVKGLLEELRARCAAVLAADDAQLAALRALVAVTEESARLARAEKANEPQWAQVETQLAAQLTTSTAEVVRVEAQRKADAAACPREAW
jgi:hypothetical protein